MFEILSYPFFQNALIAGVFVSLIAGFLGPLVVMRKEPNITHAIANILFLWIVVSFFFSGNYYLFGIISAICGIIFLTLIEKYSSTSRESSKEILAQIWLAGGIFLVGFLGNLQLDIFNFLFGNILFVKFSDIYLLSGLLFCTAVWSFFFGKKILRVILSPEIAKSQWLKVWVYNFFYLLFLSLFIAFSVKIFWVMLLWAFLVFPANIWKNISKNILGVFVISLITSLFAVISGLFASYYFDSSAGASIVLILALMLIISLFLRRN